MATCKQCGASDRPRYHGKAGEDGWYCDICVAPPKTYYGDETERIIHKNMGLGKTRDAYLERHRAQKAEFLRKHPNVVKGWKPTEYK